MKTFACKEIMPACDWETKAESEDEVLKKAGEHGREKHGLTQLSDEMKSKVRSKIRDVKAA